MRALRILVIVAVILGGLFVIADRVAVGFAEDEAAEQLKTSEGLAKTPDVSIKGFPFLTQVASGELDEVAPPLALAAVLAGADQQPGGDACGTCCPDALVRVPHKTTVPRAVSA